MLIILSGSSGVGKNTIINELLKTEQFEFMPTMTTRATRAGEKSGNPYFFVSKEEFEQKIANGEFFEWERLHNENYYGTHRQTLQNALQSGKMLIKDIDVLGTLNLKKILQKENIPCVSIFLTVEKEILYQRLAGRGERDIEIRLQRFEMEQSHSSCYDFIINNTDKDVTVAEILKISKGLKIV